MALITGGELALRTLIEGGVETLLMTTEIYHNQRIVRSNCAASLPRGNGAASNRLDRFCRSHLHSRCSRR